MECEISFRLTRDLPPRGDEYSEAEVFDALEACAAFELVDSRFRDLKSAMEQTPYEFYADHIANGAMVFGAFRKDWQTFDFTKTRVSMKQGGQDHHRKDRRPSDRQSGASPPWCWPTCAAAPPGSRPAAFIVTGSFTGFHPVELNQPVTGEFEGFGTMEATIVG